MPFLKMGQSRPHFGYYNIYNCVKNVHLVSDPGIRTHNLLNVSILRKQLGQGSRPIPPLTILERKNNWLHKYNAQCAYLESVQL